MNKSYAFGFLIVLFVVLLGLYVALTGFMSSREALRDQSASAASTQAAQASATPTRPVATEAPTLVLLPTTMPGITATLTAIAPTAAGESLPTQPPALQPTEPPPAQPTDTPELPTPPLSQPPTPISAPAYQFRLAGPPVADASYPSCCYIYGTVRDAAGNGLEGVQVQVKNEWNPPVVAASKGGVDLGKYDIPIGREVIIWYVILVDAGGNQISSQVQIQFDPNIANAYRVDWQRTY